MRRNEASQSGVGLRPPFGYGKELGMELGQSSGIKTSGCTSPGIDVATPAVGMSLASQVGLRRVAKHPETGRDLEASE